MKTSRHAAKWVESGRSLARSPAATYLAKVGPGSRRTVQQSFTSLASMLAGEGADPHKVKWEQLTRVDTVKLRTQLKEKFAPATANKMLSVLRGTLRAARDMGIMKEGEFQTAASLELIKASPPAECVPVTNQIVASLFGACASDAAGRRDAAMLAIFLSSGLRRAEAAALDMGDYDPKSGRLHIRGERPEYDRMVTLPRSARKALADWIRIRTAEPGPLLLPIDRGGLMQFRRMTDQAIYDIFGRIADRAGVKNLTLRDVRRSYVISLVRSGKDPEEVQYLIGHASWFTTATYKELAGDARTECYDLDKRA